MSAETNLQMLSGLFDMSCVELFTGLNCTIEKTDEPMARSADDPIAIVDAGSDELEIAVVLQLPVNILALSYRSDIDITQVAEEVLEDWIAELSNQLIGKLKNKLLAYNVQLKLGLPNAYFGADISELIPKTQHYIVSVFNIDNELLEIVLCVDILDDSLDLSATSVDDDGPVGGELELF
ncbi:MAG: hypothetical protein R3208_01615 [Ketobacteraceae bacterium]|nr:hypothetical protein [Ketobacteraceae bacterium]